MPPDATDNGGCTKTTDSRSDGSPRTTDDSDSTAGEIGSSDGTWSRKNSFTVVAGTLCGLDDDVFKNKGK